MQLVASRLSTIHQEIFHPEFNDGFGVGSGIGRSRILLRRLPFHLAKRRGQATAKSGAYGAVLFHRRGGAEQVEAPGTDRGAKEGGVEGCSGEMVEAHSCQEAKETSF